MAAKINNMFSSVPLFSVPFRSVQFDSVRLAANLRPPFGAPDAPIIYLQYKFVHHSLASTQINRLRLTTDEARVKELATGREEEAPRRLASFW